MKKHDGIYERRNGKYRYLGHQWSGFPADGIWLVQDGQKAMSCLIGSKEKVPMFALNYRIHEHELCKVIQNSMKKGGLSLIDEARLCCDFFAKKAEEKHG